MMSIELYTIGHSTHPIQTFLSLLAQYEIAILADVRSFPSSRRWPQFNHDELKASVERSGMSYEWFKVLGGRRRSSLRDSPHMAWQHAAFRSYADYADTAEFVAGIERLSKLAAARRSAIMCSEGLWWRCHRRIIADHMVVRGWHVRHIMPDGKLAAHSLPDFARIDEARIIYDGSGE
ncbi:MAG: DUF488 domain-containing protein [Deltaproteobacteria bacterium]|nr:DUF488 domain-containing protein [Deltaproteobacteria bacterium]